MTIIEGSVKIYYEGDHNFKSLHSFLMALSDKAEQLGFSFDAVIINDDILSYLEENIQVFPKSVYFTRYASRSPEYVLAEKARRLCKDFGWSDDKTLFKSVE